MFIMCGTKGTLLVEAWKVDEWIRLKLKLIKLHSAHSIWLSILELLRVQLNKRDFAHDELLCCELWPDLEIRFRPLKIKFKNVYLRNGKDWMLDFKLFSSYVYLKSQIKLLFCNLMIGSGQSDYSPCCVQVAAAGWMMCCGAVKYE